MAEDVDSNTEVTLNVLRELMNERIPPVTFQPESREGEKEFLPVCSDPKEYLQILRGTSEYGRMVDGRFDSALKTWKRAFRGKVDYFEPPTKDEVRATFEDSESFKQLFWNFCEGVLHLTYDKGQYSSKFCEAFEEYRIAARKELLTFATGKDRDEMTEADRERSKRHDKVAEVLVQDGVVGTKYLARILVRAFLVDLGEDNISSARVADQQRVLRNLASDRRAVADYLGSVDLQAKAEEFFSERRSIIQEEYLKKHPGSSFVEKKQFCDSRQFER